MVEIVTEFWFREYVGGEVGKYPSIVALCREGKLERRKCRSGKLQSKA